ncbi:integrase arm-type DNA-binding domain-containing protein [Erwinia aphidicola]|uniref:tyrosine-type recombinase/integrase n=1 Tax=Erwinia aphidicola TaxID=68334 RepID=UPI0030CC4586
MLTDTKLKNLKPRDKLYKVSDRDGLYVAVAKSGTVSFRFDYRIHGRRETLTIGKYGADGITLAEARDRLNDARKLLEKGESPAIKKQEGKSVIRTATRFKDFAALWARQWKVAESTRQLRMAILNKEILPVFGNKLLHEITHTRLLEECEKVRDRGAPSTALNMRQLVSKVFRYAQDRGYECDNPAERISAGVIAKFTPRTRSLSEKEIGIFFNAIERTGTSKTIVMALKFVLYTMIRKSEFRLATIDMVDWEERTLTLPAELMKMNRAHRVFLSDQAYDILVGLDHVFVGAKYLHPGRFSPNEPLSEAALNAAIRHTLAMMEKEDKPMERFSVHDLRRTASTLLHEREFNTDWIEKCLAHEQRNVRAVYNKAEYATQRRMMLQQWADMVDGWIEKEKGKG